MGIMEQARARGLPDDATRSPYVCIYGMHCMETKLSNRSLQTTVDYWLHPPTRFMQQSMVGLSVLRGASTRATGWKGTRLFSDSIGRQSEGLGEMVSLACPCAGATPTVSY